MKLIRAHTAKLQFLCTCLWLYKTFENRKKVYSKIIIRRKIQKLNFEKTLRNSLKMEKSPEDVIKSETDQKPR